MTERKLDRLNANNSSGLAFQRLWQKNAELVEGFVGDLQGQIDDIAAALAAAVAAQASATAAQATANTVKTSDKITSSSVIPADVLTASDAGTDASVAVANHTRLYGDATQLAVTGATLTALAYATDYGVYYDDPTCADTTPTYVATTTLSHALSNYVEGRHFVGNVTTPASGAGSTTGGSSPPGTGGGYHSRYDTL